MNTNLKQTHKGLNILFNVGKSFTPGGAPMKTAHFDVEEIQQIAATNVAKNDKPWLQMFNCGYRVDSKHIDWNNWNGCVFLDIDSKHYYNECRQFNPNALEDALFMWFSENYDNLLYAIQRSDSGTGYHIILYFNIEKNEANFKKAANYALELCKSAFIGIGAFEIWNWPKVSDRCSISPYQGMYFTSQEVTINVNCTGRWEGINEYEVEEYTHKIDKVKEHEVDFVNFSHDNEDTTEVYYEHIVRMKIYTALCACFKTKDEVNNAWVNLIVPYLKEGNGHNKRFYINEPEKNGWYEKFDTIYVNEKWLEPFGFQFKKRFIPHLTGIGYEPDVVVKLEEGKYLSDVDVKFKYDRINHIYAGCGVGKTVMSKQLGADVDDIEFLFNGKNRICFISPLKSIIKDSFECVDGWDIVDGDHKDVKTGYQVLNGNHNVCTTWESFVLYDMNTVRFDYIIVDEAHTLYMYDYRVNSIRKFKDAFRTAIGTKILMSGTPSYEVEEFDCYKIKVEKVQKTIDCELVCYNNEYMGYIIEDIKEWTKDNNHVALLFYDTTNYKLEDRFKSYGLDIEVFCKSNEVTTEWILTNNTIRSQITAFSVYGQAGINLYIEYGKKARMYILNNNALSIIQYANRIRNKECIDKMIIPWKQEKISSDIKSLDKSVDIMEGIRKVDVLKKTEKVFEIFSTKNLPIFRLTYKLSQDCIDWNEMELIEPNYKVYGLISNVGDYEKQLQVVYNRLVESFFKVEFVYLENDIELKKNTKLRNNQFAGQMMRFDESMVKLNKVRDRVWLEPSIDFNKVLTGDSKEVIEKLLNYIYLEVGRDMDEMISVFKGYIAKIIKETSTIKKADLARVKLLYELKANWSHYYNSALITVMLDERWDTKQITAVYMRTIWHDEMSNKDLEELSEEAYNKISAIRKVVVENPGVFMALEKEIPSEPMKFENDDIVAIVLRYLNTKHSKGMQTKNTKRIEIDGKVYDSAKSAMESLNVSKMTISRWVKSGKAIYV